MSIIASMQLITGGMGFIGLHTARALLDQGESCVLATQSGTVRGCDFIKGEIGKRIFVERLDVSDLEAVLELQKRHRITGIVHLSGASLAGTCEPMRKNALHLLNVLQAAQDWKLRRVSIASTIGVYAGASLGPGPLHEDQPLPMIAFHPIPAFKKISELLAITVGGSAGFEVVNFRFGAWGPLFHHPPSPMNILCQLVRAAVQGKTVDLTQPCSRAFAEDGTDLAYVKDCGRAIALLQLADKLNHRTYNIGAGKAIKNRDFAAALKRLIPSATFELPEGFDPNGPRRLFDLDITRICQDTGYQPQYDVERGIADYVAWLRAGHDV
jgi:UDP-glucose 4-epimerase